MKSTPTLERTSLHVSRPLSVLAQLRAVTPNRPLRYAEHERIAELQANKLLAAIGITGPPVPTELISELPRILVAPEVDLPVSGAAQWVAGRWVIAIAAADHPTRQRFSLAHEFKHVVDHPLRHLIYRDQGTFAAEAQAERIAEYFAACLLLPKRWVVKAWTGGMQRLSDLSRHFDVSPRAMQIRLWQLGLAEPQQRCATPTRQGAKQ